MTKISYINDSLPNLSIKILVSIGLFLGSFGGLWAQKTKDIWTFETDTKIIQDIYLDAKGESLAVVDDRQISIFDLESQKLLRSLENGHSAKIISIAISSDNHYLVSTDIAESLVLWDFEKGLLLEKLEVESGVIHDLEISPDNRFLLLGGKSSKVIIYDLDQKEVVKEIQDHKNMINAVAFSPDTSLMATAGTDKKIRIYTLPDFELLTELHEHTNTIRDLCFGKGSKRLISTGDDSKVIIWTLKDRENIRVYRKSRIGGSWIFGVDFYSEDEVSYGSGGLDGNVRIYTTFGKFSWKAGVPIQKILLKPYEKKSLKVILATRGKGVLFVDLSKVQTKME